MRKTLKEFKSEIKRLGFNYKTEVIGRFRRLQILDHNKEFICGSGVNVYSRDTINKYPLAFKLIKDNKDCVFDEEGDKVLF